jgi:ATP-dependent exoDNAse (exonuclease V) beta subunit
MGSLAHRVIERLPRDASLSRNEIATNLEAVLKSETGRHVAAVDAASLTRRVQALVESELWSEMCSAARCYREIDFLLGWPIGKAPTDQTAIIAGALDCLLLLPSGQWKIIDYKTGRLPDGDPTVLLEHFSIQLVLYAEAVKAMVGRPPASIEIVSLEEKTRRFPLILWDEFRRPVFERIDAAIKRLSGTAEVSAGV